MVRSIRTVLVAAAISLLLGTADLAGGEVPPRSESGQTLVIPAEHLDAGDVYHVTPGSGTQFMWTAEAGLLRLTAVCNRVVGYFVSPFDIEDGQPPMVAGAFRIPVASLNTGLEQYDAELHSPMWLNAAEYPEITFITTKVGEAKLLSSEERSQKLRADRHRRTDGQGQDGRG